VRIGEDEEIKEDDDPEATEKLRREREARAQALTLEMVGDLPFADVKPPENILFVCKLNPVTQDEDLHLIFSRFGTILSCEVIRDKRTGDSLQYAFIEFEDQKACEQAYFKMQGVLIDDHRIHVDFSQSVSKLSDTWRSATNAKRQNAANARGFGGFNQLEKRRQYREGNDKSQGIPGSRNTRYVFDEADVRRRAETSRSERDDRGSQGDRHRDGGRERHREQDRVKERGGKRDGGRSGRERGLSSGSRRDDERNPRKRQRSRSQRRRYGHDKY